MLLSPSDDGSEAIDHANSCPASSTWMIVGYRWISDASAGVCVRYLYRVRQSWPDHNRAQGARRIFVTPNSVWPAWPRWPNKGGKISMCLVLETLSEPGGVRVLVPHSPCRFDLTSSELLWVGASISRPTNSSVRYLFEKGVSSQTVVIEPVHI